MGLLLKLIRKHIRCFAVLIPALAMTTACHTAVNSTTPAEGLRYSESDCGGGRSIIGFGTWSGENLVIPEKSDYDGVINGIGADAFRDDPDLKSVTVLAGLWTIGQNAFYRDLALEKVSFATKSLQRIGDGAFSMTGIREINLPDSVIQIGANCFYRCGNLRKFTFPDGVQVIESCVLGECTNLQEVVLPENAERICDHAFFSCEKLKEVEVPDSVTEIGAYAFARCNELKTVLLPKNLFEFDATAFSECPELTEIRIPENLHFSVKGNCLIDRFDGILVAGTDYSEIPRKGINEIGANAFIGRNKLKTVLLPESLTAIRAHAFEGCESLEGIAIPEGVTVIEDCAFFRCHAMQSLSIPDSVQTIGDSAFAGCTLLTSVSLGAGTEQIGRMLFENCVNLEEVDLGERITVIPGNTFSYCKNLKKVTIGRAVVRIDDSAFRNCPNLTDIFYGGTKAEWEGIEKYVWNHDLEDYYANLVITIHCTDGDVVIKSKVKPW